MRIAYEQLESEFAWLNSLARNGGMTSWGDFRRWKEVNKCLRKAKSGKSLKDKYLRTECQVAGK